MVVVESSGYWLDVGAEGEKGVQKSTQISEVPRLEEEWVSVKGFSRESTQVLEETF